MKVIKTIIFILFSSVLLIFILENFETLSQPLKFEFNLKFWSIKSYPLPLGFYFCIVFLAGFILGIADIVLRKLKRK